MSASKVWVIGSSPECDVVIANFHVSRKHCRLTWEDGRFVLQDLKSTNGTFVNGEKVSGKTEVTLDDQIHLASDVEFPWPDDACGLKPSESAAKSSSRTQISIGRDPENDLVLDDESISNQHAILTLSNGEAILEDLGSINGTAINTPENAIKKHRLDPGDVVFFGSLRVPAKKLLGDNFGVR